MIDLTSLAFDRVRIECIWYRSFIVAGVIAMLAINGVPESLASTLVASITSTDTALLSKITKKREKTEMTGVMQLEEPCMWNFSRTGVRHESCLPVSRDFSASASHAGQECPSSGIRVYPWAAAALISGCADYPAILRAQCLAFEPQTTGKLTHPAALRPSCLSLALGFRHRSELVHRALRQPFFP